MAWPNPSRTRTKGFHIVGLPTPKPAESHLQVALVLQQGAYYILTGVAEMEQEAIQVAEQWQDKLQQGSLGQAWNL